MEPPPTASPRPPAPPRLTARDRELLEFAAEHRFVLAAQLGRLLGGSAMAIGRRLSALREAGLVHGERPLSHETTAWALTGRGLAAVDSDLPRPRRVDLATYRHDVGVAWLHVAARCGLFGELTEVVSERRMRSEDRRRDRDGEVPHGVRLTATGPPGPRLHYPDLVLRTAGGHRVAFELELTMKAPARRERILAAYASDPRTDAVVYLVPTRAAAEAINRSATRAGARGLVSAQRFTWAGGRAPGEPPRARRRETRRARSAEAGR